MNKRYMLIFVSTFMLLFAVSQNNNPVHYRTEVMQSVEIKTVPIKDGASPQSKPEKKKQIKFANPIHEAKKIVVVKPKPTTSSYHSYYSGNIANLVESIFAKYASSQINKAMCVAHRESRFDPMATNSHSDAKGIFQWMPRTWANVSVEYGFPGVSAYDAYANITVAAKYVADYGWSPWNGPGC